MYQNQEDRIAPVQQEDRAMPVRISKTKMKIFFKIIMAIIALWLIVYGSSFIGGMTAAILGTTLHWSDTAIAWCVRVVQFIVVFGFLNVLYLVMRQKKPTVK